MKIVFVLVLLLGGGEGNMPRHDKQEQTYETLPSCRKAGRLKVAENPFVRGYVCIGPDSIDAMQLPD